MPEDTDPKNALFGQINVPNYPGLLPREREYFTANCQSTTNVETRFPFASSLFSNISLGEREFWGGGIHLSVLLGIWQGGWSYELDG